jgi:hypothetical protein
MTVPLTIPKALAPLAAAALHQASGTYTSVAVVTAAACATAAALLGIDPPRPQAGPAHLHHELSCRCRPPSRSGINPPWRPRPAGTTEGADASPRIGVATCVPVPILTRFT